jgi:hypothetical protein
MLFQVYVVKLKRPNAELNGSITFLSIRHVSESLTMYRLLTWKISDSEITINPNFL